MANRLPIVTHPDPILRRPATDVDPGRIADRGFQAFLEDMTRTMHEADGIGLAAIQVASPDNVAVVNTEDGPLHLINPRIVSYGGRRETDVEACLSVPGFAGDVRRNVEIHVTALDRHGKPLDLDVSGLYARVIQHEVDHLRGILYIDRAERIWAQVPERKKATA